MIVLECLIRVLLKKKKNLTCVFICPYGDEKVSCSHLDMGLNASVGEQERVWECSVGETVFTCCIGCDNIDHPDCWRIC